MSKPNIEIDRAKEIAAEMECSLSHFKTFIANMERFVASTKADEPQPPTILVEVEKTISKPEIYTIKTLAAELGVSERTIRRYCDEGLIRYMQIRGKIRFALKDVEEFYRDHYREKF